MSNRTFKLLDNENATMFAGPGRDDAATGREFTTWLKSGNAVTHWANGSKTEVITGSSKEVCNTDPSSVGTKEQVAKSIYCPHGDFVVVADNIKFKGKNIYFEAEGPGRDGQIDIRSNGIMSISSNETIMIQGGEVRITGEKDVILDANGFLYLIGDIKNSGAPSVAGIVGSFMSGSWAGILQGVSNTYRTIA